MGIWQSIANGLALRRNTSLMLLCLVFAGTGERLWLGFAPKYIETLGAGVVAIGLFDGVQTLLGALYAYPGGWITDHFGRRRSLIAFTGISLIGYVVVLIWHHWLALVLGSCLFLAWSGLSLPATFSVVANTLKQNQYTMGIGMQSLIRRVPMMLGPLIGGWLIWRFGWEKGVQVALAGCVLMSAVTGLLQWFMADQDVGSCPAGAPVPGLGFTAVVRSFTPTLRELLVSDILIRFCERIPYAFVILWAIDHGGVSAQQFGLLVTVEMVTAMLCYLPVARLADRYGRRPFVLVTFGFFTLFPISLIGAGSFAALAFAFFVRGLKEFGEPARKALIIGEAEPALRSRTYGAYYLIRDCVVTTGSALGAWLWSISPRANFIGAALCGGAGTLWFWWFVFRRPVGGVHSTSP